MRLFNNGTGHRACSRYSSFCIFEESLLELVILTSIHDHSAVTRVTKKLKGLAVLEQLAD